MRLKIALLLALAIMSPASSEERHKQLAAVDIVPPTPAATQSQDAPPSGLPMTIVVPATAVLSSAIAAAAASEQGRARTTLPNVSAQSAH